MAIKALKRPTGAAAGRHAFKNEATGNDWHAEFEWRDGQAGTATAVVVRIMRPDGTALEGSHGHTFTEEELAEPDFDADAKLTALVEQRIARAESILASRTKLAAAKEKWASPPA